MPAANSSRTRPSRPRKVHGRIADLRFLKNRCDLPCCLNAALQRELKRLFYPCFYLTIGLGVLAPSPLYKIRIGVEGGHHLQKRSTGLAQQIELVAILDEGWGRPKYRFEIFLVSANIPTDWVVVAYSKAARWHIWGKVQWAASGGNIPLLPSAPPLAQFTGGAEPQPMPGGSKGLATGTRQECWWWSGGHPLHSPKLGCLRSLPLNPSKIP